MKVLIRNAEILIPGSKHHLKKRNVLIANGKISYIGSKAPESDKLLEGNELKVSAGWIDMNVLFGDPGFEHREDLNSGLDTAAHSGFTSVALLPNTSPAIQTKNDIIYVKGLNSKSITQVLPYAAVTRDLKGEDLTDMIDLDNAGAVGFTDGTTPIWKSDILLKTLLYLQKFDGLLISRPEDIYLNMFGSMHEGKISTLLGLKGMPAISEEIILARDLRLLEYTGGKIHFANISTKRSVQLIKDAKKKGLNVTCDVAIHQLIYSDEELMDYDTNFKVNPPLRSESDIKALIKGVSDGTIDALVSAHQPQDEEGKKLEFDLAEFGMTGLQTMLPNMLKLTENLDLDRLVEMLTITPRQILGIENPIFEEGESADLTIFSTKLKWKLDKKSNRSKSINSPLMDKELMGKIVAVFNNNKQLIIG